jgi:hypothetical protein
LASLGIFIKRDHASEQTHQPANCAQITVAKGGDKQEIQKRVSARSIMGKNLEGCSILGQSACFSHFSAVCMPWMSQQ